MSAAFDKAVSYVQGLPKDGPVKVAQNDQLEFYKYYKQATVGDVNIPRPGLMDFTGKAKWQVSSCQCSRNLDAWNSIKGTSPEEARKKYVEKLLEILNTNPDNEDNKKLIQELQELSA
ncbi:acyl-CoA-binding protein [Leucogyrophana mollusca]|uniref:Acyl-CoA-binding protein n=1 Tax=Leucogyrophana mollusca TaxID=85980 RepID=A0ACB8BLU3_9AGAM|nr:acyl-CoA-binding protein [Leucogyrophana mollusca]